MASPRAVITVPVNLQKRINKQKLKLALKEREKAGFNIKGKTPVIVCSRSQLNHYKGQRYSKFSPVPLISKDWMKGANAVKTNKFIINSYSSNPSMQSLDEGEEYIGFDHLGVDSNVVTALAAMNVKHPTVIQEYAIPEILKGSNIVCAAETGSGKTLAYLTPLVQNILRLDQVSVAKPPSNHPRGLILVPGRELAEQVLAAARSLTDGSTVRADMVVGGRATQLMLRAGRISHGDILVATPGVLRKLLAGRRFFLNYCNYVVVDEADTLLDDSFNEILCSILHKIKFRVADPDDVHNAAFGAQIIFVGATMPKSLDAILDGIIEVDSLVKVEGPHLHRVMPHVAQKFIRLHAQDRLEELLQLVKSDAKKKKPVIIFCNTSKGSHFVHLFLTENGVSNVQVNGVLAEKVRRGRFQAFQDGLHDIMVCTDVGSRGLDTLRVQHIINFDFPPNMSDYIHRCGRTGRVGGTSSGHVTSFVCYKNDVELVQRIEMSVRKMENLGHVNANIKRKLIYRHFKRTGEADERIPLENLPLEI